MKISKETHVVLEKISKKTLGKQGFFDFDMQSIKILDMIGINDIFKKYVNYFSENLIVYTKNYVQQASQNSEMLLDLYKDICIENIDDFKFNGTFITSDYVHMIYHLISQDQEKIDIIYFLFHKDGCLVAFYLSNVHNSLNIRAWASRYFQTQYKLKNQDDINSFFIQRIGDLIAFNMFENYKGVIKESLYPNQASKHSEEKIINQTDFKINVLEFIANGTA